MYGVRDRSIFLLHGFSDIRISAIIIIRFYQPVFLTDFRGSTYMQIGTVLDALFNCDIYVQMQYYFIIELYHIYLILTGLATFCCSSFSGISWHCSYLFVLTNELYNQIIWMQKKNVFFTILLSSVFALLKRINIFMILIHPIQKQSWSTFHLFKPFVSH